MTPWATASSSHWLGRTPVTPAGSWNDVATAASLLMCSPPGGAMGGPDLAPPYRVAVAGRAGQAPRRPLTIARTSSSLARRRRVAIASPIRHSPSPYSAEPTHTSGKPAAHELSEATT